MLVKRRHYIETIYDQTTLKSHCAVCARTFVSFDVGITRYNARYRGSPWLVLGSKVLGFFRSTIFRWVVVVYRIKYRLFKLYKSYWFNWCSPYCQESLYSEKSANLVWRKARLNFNAEVISSHQTGVSRHFLNNLDFYEKNI